MADQQAPSMFVFYRAVLDAKRKGDGIEAAPMVPKYLIPASSLAAAIAEVKEPGTVVPAEECDSGDLVRLILPSLVMQLVQVTQLLAVIAQDAGQRIQEREKGRLGLVRGN